jgi:hypothetical protein
LMIPGNLHGGGFHFLAVVYLLYYGGFLQAIQFALGWKRIRGSDVTKTYQQCASLALLVLGEVERGLYRTFISNLVSERGIPFFESFEERPKALASFLGRQFLEWVQKKASSTTDEVFRLCLYYLLLTRKYKLFRLSVRNGDSILVEYLYEYFIPIWLSTSKHNYVEIALNQIEDLYGRVPFHVLQAARENRMQPIHKGVDRDGTPMAQWALDAVMELLQIKYKAMNFPNSREGWQNHSTNMPLVSRAKIFCQSEYSRRYDVESYDEQFFEFEAAGEKQDKGNTKTQAKTPRRNLEKIMVSEILLLVDAFNETDHRAMNVKVFWSVLKDVTTTFEDEAKDDDECEGNDGRSEGELALVEVNRELMRNSPLENETTEEVADANEMDQLAWFQQLEDEDAAMFDAAMEAEDENNYDEDDNEIGDSDLCEDRSEARNASTRRSDAHLVVDERETEITIGKNSKKVQVRITQFNRMGLRNVYEDGRSKMRKMKIPAIRFRSRCRIKREITTLQAELNNYLHNKDGVSKTKSIIKKLRQPDAYVCCDNRVEFRLMKKGMWVVPLEYRM